MLCRKGWTGNSQQTMPELNSNICILLSLFRLYRLLGAHPVKISLPARCQQDYLSLEGYTVSNLGRSPGLVGCKERLAWRAIRPRRWRREPQRRRRTLSCCSDRTEVRWHRWRPCCGAEECFSVAAILFKGLSWFFFSSTQVPSKSKKCRMKIAFLPISAQPYIYIFCFPTTLHTSPQNPTQ